MAGLPPPLGTHFDGPSDGASVIDDERRLTDRLLYAPEVVPLLFFVRRSHRSSRLAKEVSAKFSSTKITAMIVKHAMVLAP
ncbi:hypothetical protein [Streptomyces sp. NPDC002559]